MKLLSFFSGIGAFEKALKNLDIPYELCGFSEIDKYAIKSYCAIHGVDESMNIGDITRVDEKSLPKNIDLITYGFPCQDISIAGNQKGFFNEDGTKTRSGLFFEAMRIIGINKPKVAIAENVKNLTSKKFSEQFKIVLDSLEAAGYNNYWKVLNAKDYGIPQNRERVFIISIRKDIDKGFTFPQPVPLELRLKDILEDKVDEKYYLSEKLLSGFIKRKEIHKAKGNGFGANFNDPDTTEVSATISARYGKDGSECLIVREATKQGYAEASIGDSVNLEHPNSKTRRGRVGKQVAQMLTTSPQQGVVISDRNVVDPIIVASRGRNPENSSDRTAGSPTVQRLEPNSQGICNTLTTVQKDNYVCEPSLRIRKLTPKECFRLMGFDDEDFTKAQAVNSNTQLYKQAGNSIVVPVVEHIISALIDCGALKEL